MKCVHDQIKAQIFTNIWPKLTNQTKAQTRSQVARQIWNLVIGPTRRCIRDEIEASL